MVQYLTSEFLFGYLAATGEAMDFIQTIPECETQLEFRHAVYKHLMLMRPEDIHGSIPSL